ncbi:hypothetical protein C8J57DRAFT_1619421 [Mycena rebaudengoi]|nr:hypothetical protein C8J57DRAFT_1619421 [Mycena rebaudengoi]
MAKKSAEKALQDELAKLPGRREARHDPNAVLSRTFLTFIADETVKALAETKKKKTKKIPRPSGQAGRGNGFNLQNAIGLSEKSEHFNRLSRLVRSYSSQYLPTGDKSIQQQDKKTLEKVIAMIKEKITFFQRFEGGWPIRDLIKQHLLNSKDRRKRDLEKERKAEEAGFEDMDGGDEEESSDDIDAEDEGEVGEEAVTPDDPLPDDDDEFTLDFPDLDSDNLDEELTAPVGLAKGKKLALDFDLDDLASTPSPPKKAKTEYKATKKLREKSTVPSGPKSAVFRRARRHPLRKKRKAPDSPADNERVPKRTKLRIPDIPSHEVLELFRQKHDLLATDPKNTKAANQLVLDICCQLTFDTKRTDALLSAKSKGWPLSFDDGILHARVLRLKDEVLSLLSSPAQLSESAIWFRFLEHIGFKLTKDSFGPKGAKIMTEAIRQILHQTDASNTLCETLTSLIDVPQDWDRYDPTSNIIDLDLFIQLVIVPAVATILICQDLKVDEEEAIVVLTESSDFGDYFQDMPQPETTQPPPRHRRSVGMSPSSASSSTGTPQSRAPKDQNRTACKKPKTVTLEDFPSPKLKKVVPRKASAKENAETKPVIKKPVPTSPKKAPSARPYNTRRKKR